MSVPSRLVIQQVLDRFVSTYGARILAEPPDAGFGRPLHHAPWVAGLVSFVGLGFYIRNVTRRRDGNGPATVDQRPGAEAPARTPATDPRLGADEACNRRLDDELRDLD